MPSFTLQAHSKQLLIASSIVVIPMVTFTVVILVLVFANLAEHLHCPYDGICPNPPLINATRSSYYYIDYPATRLVFVASWSSTVSFALVGALMSTFAYTAATQLVAVSNSHNEHNTPPTTYQASLLIRVLGADYFSLWEMLRSWTNRCFKSRAFRVAHEDKKKPAVLRASIIALCLALLASVLVHAADAYLHIATEAVQMIQLFPQTPSQNRHGRSIDPWCFDNSDTMRTIRNKNFWGCGATIFDDKNPAVTNETTFFAVRDEGLGKYVMNFTESNGDQYAVIGPIDLPSDTDWQATSFALSSQCRPIPATSCDIGSQSETLNGNGRSQVPFNCSIARCSPIDFSGNVTGSGASYTFFDYHKYMYERGKSFNNVGQNFTFSGDAVSFISNLTAEEGAEVFPTTWKWTAALDLGIAIRHQSLPDDMVGQAWPLKWGYFMVISCNTTVYDVKYSAIEGTVTDLSARTSNSTTAGIPILASLNSLGALMDLKFAVSRFVNPPASLESWISSYEIAMSTLFATPLAVHTVPADSLLVQTRVNKIMTKVPVAAVWLLVLANMAFAALGFGLTLMAWRTSDENIHQVRVRLGVPGLVAALFEKESGDRVVKSDRALFQENDDNAMPASLVVVHQTATGGVAWSLRDSHSSQPCMDNKSTGSNTGVDSDGSQVYVASPEIEMALEQYNDEDPEFTQSVSHISSIDDSVRSLSRVPSDASYGPLEVVSGERDVADHPWTEAHGR